MKEIKEFALKFTPRQLDTCIREQLRQGDNSCALEGPVDEVIGTLSKAEYVKRLMERGVPMVEAVRDLARRIRAVQEGFSIEE